MSQNFHSALYSQCTYFHEMPVKLPKFVTTIMWAKSIYYFNAVKIELGLGSC